MAEQRYVITDIGPNDAYASNKAKLIGLRFKMLTEVPLQKWEDSDWFYGEVVITSKTGLSGWTAFHEVAFRAIPARTSKKEA